MRARKTMMLATNRGKQAAMLAVIQAEGIEVVEVPVTRECSHNVSLIKAEALREFAEGLRLAAREGVAPAMNLTAAKVAETWARAWVEKEL